MVRRMTFFSVLAVLVLGLIAGCAPNSPAAPSAASSAASGAMDMSHLKMAALSQMPAEVQSAPVTVQEAYRFNVANPDLMKQVPCYCGCGAVGHTSNYACYVDPSSGDKITFDQHALGCGICVDITRDAMRMSAQGESPQAIKAYVDKTYSQYGPSNIP